MVSCQKVGSRMLKVVVGFIVVAELKWIKGSRKNDVLSEPVFEKEEYLC